MDIAKEAVDTVAQQRPEEKQNRLEMLSQIFERAHGLDPVDVGKGGSQLMLLPPSV